MGRVLDRLRDAGKRGRAANMADRPPPRIFAPARRRSAWRRALTRQAAPDAARFVEEAVVEDMIGPLSTALPAFRKTSRWVKSARINAGTPPCAPVRKANKALKPS